MRRALALLVVVLSLVGLGACGSSTSSSTRPTVVATTTILGDLVQRVGGDAVDVEVLMPPGADPHEFEPSAAQAARLRGADLIVANGLGLEERLASTLDAARDDGVTVYEVGPDLDPQPLDAGLAEHGSDGHVLDPHVWLDPDRMATAAGLVAAQIAQATGLERAGLDERAAAYAEEAKAAGQRADAILAAVPAERRMLVTNHDALGYFARRFGLGLLGTVIPGGSTLAEPSAADLSRLADDVRRTGTTAVFSENTVSPRLMEALAREVGRSVAVVELSTDSLGEEGSPTATYAGMIETDARLIADGLTGAA